MDFRTLPAEHGDPLIEAGRSYRKLTEAAREEIRNYRQVHLVGKRTWGCQDSRVPGHITTAFRVGSGKIVTGDKPTKMRVTPLLDTLASEAKLPVQGAGFEVLQGYGSVFDVGYILHDMFGPYVEYMASTAFDASLALPELQMSYLRSHEGLGLATTMGGRMAVGKDDYGLGFAASMSLAEADAAELVAKLRSKSTSNQTSVGGWIRDFEWDEDYTEIEVLDWWMSRGEISSVHAGANPAGWADVRVPKKGSQKSQKNASGGDGPTVDLGAYLELQKLR